MRIQSKAYIIGIIAGILIFAAGSGCLYACYKQKARLFTLAKQVYKRYVYAKDAREINEYRKIQKAVPKLGEISVTIDPTKEIGKISPFLYGSNLAPKMQSEAYISKFARELGVSCFRFPGGGSPGYHWKTGKFDFDTRNTNAPLRDINYMIDFCKKSGARLIIQVNVESGTAQEAAEWVEYMNKKADFPVIYWELGNEVYGDWDSGYMSADKYAGIIKEYAIAMKKVDPGIKIGMDWAYLTRNNFNKVVLQKAAGYIDFISCHWYPNQTNPNHIYEGRIHPTAKEVMANYLQIPLLINRAKKMIEKYAPEKKGKIEFTFLEWDGAQDGPSSDFPPYSYGIVQWSLANAIFHADCLGTMALNGVTAAAQFDFQSIGFGFIRGWDKECGWGGQSWDQETIRPKALAIQMFSKYFGDTLIEGRLENSPVYYKKSDFWPDSYGAEVPYISCYTAKFTKQGAITIMLINKHESESFKAKINLLRFKPEETGKLISLSGPNLMAQNEGNPVNIRIKEYAISNIKDTFTYNIPPHSINVLQIQERKGE